MKSKSNNCLFLTALLWLLLGVSSLVKANVVPDPSFEDGTTNWVLPDSSQTFVSSPTRTGTSALKMVNVGNGVDSPVHQTHQQDISGIVPGQEFIYTVWVKGVDVQGVGDGGKPLAVVRWKDVNGDIIRTTSGGAKESYIWAPYGTYDYRRMRIALQAPSNAKFLDVLFRTWWGTTSGETYWDDIDFAKRNFSGLGGLLATYQAEDADVMSGGNLLSDKSDYTGSGYYDINTTGAVLQWNNVVGGGDRVLSFRYSWEGNVKNMELFINGVSQGARKPLPTGRRGTWASDLWNVDLPAGNNIVQLVVTQSGGEKAQPMVDKLEVYNPGVSVDNELPNLTPIGDQAVIEGSLLNVSLSANDPDNSGLLTFSQTNDLPGNPGILTDFGNGNAELNWTPAIGDAVSGPYSITVTVTDARGATTRETFSVAVTPEAGFAGTLTGGVAAAPATTNLTTEGTLDWVHWGLTTATDVDRKAGVVAQISDFSALGGASPARGVNDTAGFTWSDGTPTVAKTNTRTAVRVFDPDRGFEFTVPADTAVRTLKVYVGAKDVGGTLEARLSDGSAALFSTQIDSFEGKSSHLVTLNYQAASDGKLLTVRYFMYSKPLSIGWISLESATLPQIGNQTPRITSAAVTQAHEGIAYSYDVDATDFNSSDILTYALTTAPAGMSIDAATGLITWTPTTQVGDHNVTVSVSDDATSSLSDSQTFIVSVAPPNVAPSISSGCSTAALEAVGYSCDVNATDANATDVLTYALTTAPTGMTIDAATGLIAWMPATAQVGDHPASVTVTDNGTPVLSDVQNLTISVAANNVAPTINSTPVTIGSDGVLYSYDVDATDLNAGDSLTYVLTTSPAGMSIDSATGLIRWTPTLAQVGDHNVTVTVSDDATPALSASQSFTISILEVNWQPVISPISCSAATVDMPFSCDINAIDTNTSDILTYSLTTSPAGMSIDAATGVITWTPVSGQEGDNAVTVTVTDDDAAPLSASQSFNVSIAAANVAPTFTSVPVTSAVEFVAYSYDVEATDANVGDILTYTLAASPAGMSIDAATGLLSWTPTAAQVGDHAVTVTVTDDGNPVLSSDQSFTVTVFSAGSGMISGSEAVSSGSVNLTTEGTEDWVHWGLGTATDLNRKAAVTAQISDLIPVSDTLLNRGVNNLSVYSWSDGTPTDSVNDTTAGIRAYQVGRGFDITVPADATVKTLKLYVGAKNVDGLLEASLSDGSAAPQSVTINQLSGTTSRVVTFSFQSASAGQTFTLRYTLANKPGSTGWISIESAALEQSNQAPSIISTPVTTASEGLTYNYDVDATDVNASDVLSYALSVAPAGMTINAATGLINWIPMTDQIGDHSVTVAVSDNATPGLSDSQSYTVSVTANNIAPVITSTPSTAANDGLPYTYDVDASDFNAGDILSFALTTAPAGMNIDAVTGVISWVPLGMGIYSVTVTVSDDATPSLSDSQSFDIDVGTSNVAPVINSTPILSGAPDIAYSYDVDASDLNVTDTLTYTLTAGPTGMSIDAVSGLISWMPTASDAGDHNVTVVVTDDASPALSDSQSFVLSVSVNTAPSITSTPITSVVESVPYSYDVEATDADSGNVLNYSLIVASPGMAIDAVSGVISWMPTTAQVGNHNVTVMVTDDGVPQLFDTQSFVISVAAANSGALSGKVDISSGSVDLTAVGTADWIHWARSTATDVDRKFGVTSQISNLIPVNSAGLNRGVNTKTVYSWTDGDPTATLVNSSSGIRAYQAGKGFEITVPADTTYKILKLYVGAKTVEGLLEATLSDSSAAPYSKTISQLSGTTSRVITLGFQAASAGQTVTVRFTLANKPGSTGWISIESAALQQTNQAPVITSTLVATGLEGVPYSYDVDATDANALDSLSYALTVAPAGMTIDSVTGLIDWTPTTAQVGGQLVEVTVTDDGSPVLSASQSFTVFVAVNNVAPVITSAANTSGNELQLYTYDVEATDFNSNDTLSYALTTAPAGMSIDSLTGVISWTPTSGQVGVNAVIVTVSDDASPSLSATQSFDVNVAEANVAPVITSVPVTTGLEGVAYNYDVDATDANVADVLTFSLTTAPAGMSVDPTTGIISWTPTTSQVADHSVTVAVMDNGNPVLGGSQSFTVSVAENNVAPAITSTPVITAGADVTYNYDVDAIDANAGNVLSFALTTAPAGMSIDSVTGLISWLPTTAEVGDHNVTVVVSDDASPSLSDSQSFVLNVTLNSTPGITSTPITSVVESVSYTYDVDASDSDIGDTLTFSLTESPVGMAIDAVTGLINWTPTAAQVGDHNVAVVVADDGIPVLSDKQSFVVSVAAANSGALSGKVVVSAGSVNLTTVGYTDWIQWGLNAAADVNRKIAVAPQISDLIPVNGTSRNRGTNAKTVYSWTDGDPTVSVVNTKAGIRAYQAGKGFEITVPADTTYKILKLYVGAKTVEGLLEATLSDSSAAPYSKTISQLSGTTSRVITLGFQAASAGQTVTVRFTLANKPGSTGWISIESAALQQTNQAPVITSTPVATGLEGVPYSYDMDATDANALDSLSYALTVAPAGMTIDSVTGLIDWTPTTAQVGGQLVEVTVTDDASPALSASQSFTVDVAANNVAPVITSPANTSGNESQPYTYDVEATDFNSNDTLSYAFTTGPAGMSIDSLTGVISWTPTSGQVGVNAVTVRVSDDATPSLSATQSFNVTVAEANVAPVITSAPVTTGLEGVAYSYDVDATDANVADILSFSLTTAPSGMSIDPATGIISWTPTTFQVADHSVTVAVMDNGVPVLGASQSFTVSVVANNVAPVITSTPVATAGADITYNYDVDATDANAGNVLSYALSVAPAGMSIDAASGLISWLPTAAEVGNHNVTVVVTDDASPSLSDTQSYVLSVSVNAAPVITSTEITTGLEGAVYTYDVDATDSDAGDTFSFSLTAFPTGMTIDIVTGLINWTPTAGQVGDHDITVKVTDDGNPNLSDSQSFTLTILPKGAINGGLANAPSSVSLSAEGTADWIHWARTTATDVNRKYGVTSQVSDVVLINSASFNRGVNAKTVYSWTDGAPTTSASGIAAGLRAYKVDKGFEFTVPAETTQKTLKIYVGAKNVGGLLEASLSDGSGTYSTKIDKFSGTTSQVVTLNFNAESAGQLLTVRYTLYSKPGSTGWISLESVALQGQPAVLDLPYTEDFSSGAPSWFAVDDSGDVSNWNVTNGAYRQSNFVGFFGGAMQNGYHLGSYSLMGGGTELTDYQFNVTATPMADSGQDIGVMVRANQATDSYTRLSFSAANGFGRLETKAAGVFKTLAKNARGYQQGTPLNITMEVQGPVIIAKVNGEKLFGAYDVSLSKGTVGLYCRDNCAFDDVSIQNNDATPVIVISEPTSYSVSAGTAFNVGAVVLNTPVGATVEFQLDGQAAACTSASDLGHVNHFTASCTAPSQGIYQLTAILKDQFGVQLDTDINQDVSVSDNYVVIGDSISVGLDDNTAGDGSSQNGWMQSNMGYEAILMDHLAALQSQPSIVHKAATPGDTAVISETQRMSSILERHLDANKAIITLGVNDAGGVIFTPSGLGCSGASCNGTYKGYLQSMIDQLDAAGKSTIVTLSPPRFGDASQAPYADPANHTRNLLIRDQYNVVISTELVNHHVGPDYYDYFLGSENRFYLYATNLHPNALGYAVMGQLLSNTITGGTTIPFIADNLCVKLSQAGSCQSPLTYKQNLLEVGNTYYVDQSYTLLNSIPAILNDGRWIMTSDLDRDQSNANYLSFNVPETSTVYVAYDANATTLPAWLSSNFTDTGVTIDTDNASAPSMRLYSQANVLGNVTLGGANAAANGAGANYLVIVVKD